MSASTKKKLRSEEASASLTEKQVAARKEARKVKLYTVLTCVVLALMILTVVVVAVVNSGILTRNTTALKVGDHDIKAVEMNYSYMDEINNFLNQAGNYLPLLGLDVAKPLDEQVQNPDTGATWADYFVDMAKNSLRSSYAMADAAAAEGFTLTDEENAAIDQMMDSLDAAAAAQQLPDAKSYLVALFGNGASVKTYREYYTRQALVRSYMAKHQNDLTYDDAALREAEAENYNKYSSYTYNSYYLGTSAFLTGGTTDDEGNTTYSDEEKAAAAEKAEAAFKDVVKATSLEEFDAAIAAMDVTKDKENVASTRFEDVLYGSQDMSSTITEWVTSDERVEGDITYLPATTTAEDGTVTTNGFYAVYFHSSNDNTMPLINVRHILVGFEGGTKNEDGTTTYSDEEKAAAKEKAEAILNEWKSGDATEESFGALATEKSTDQGSKANGGLYENVAPKTMVEPFDTWCFDASRKAGDTGIVETDFGYHVMYFVGNSDTTYRDAMIKTELTNTDMENWFNEIVEAVEVNEVNTSKVKKDLVIKVNG